MHCRLPVDCVLALTYNCNSRCTMCDIWKIKNSPELAPEEFLKLPSSLLDINFSGGEPYFRKDIVEILKNVVTASPAARVIISSNGFATDLIVARTKELLKIKPDIGVAISIDGIGEMHNEMRGIPGGFDKAIATVKKLKEIGVTKLRLGFTATDKNVNHLSKVYNLSEELGVEFTHSFAQNSEFYFGGKQNVHNPRGEVLNREYDYLIRQELKSWNFKRWARGYFAYGMKKFVNSHRPMLYNAPGRDFFFLDPSGDIYPSVVQNVVLKNIKEIDSQQSFEQFWLSNEAEMVRKKIDDLKIPVWMICTARTAIKKHPLKAGLWFMKHKLYAHFAS